jgi:hypothetical protein
MKTSAKSVGVAAWVAIGVAPLIYYVLVAIEYIMQYFIARVLELYLRSISGIVSPTRPAGSGLPPRRSGPWVAQHAAVIAGMVPIRSTPTNSSESGPASESQMIQ